MYTSLKKRLKSLMEVTRMNKKKIIVGVLIALSVTGGVVFLKTNATSARSQIKVQSYTLKKADLLDSVLVSGTVKSSNLKNVYSTVTNYPVKEVYFKVGDKVKAGDVLAKLDTTSLELDIKQTELNIKNAQVTLNTESSTNAYNLRTASNNLDSASLDLKNAQDTYDKTKANYDSGKSSADELSKAESSLKKAQFAYDNAQANVNNIKNKTTSASSNNIEIQKAALEKQKKTLNDAKIIAPIDGTVTLVNAKQNGAATGLLFVIEDTDNLVVSTAIGEYDIDSVKLGKDVIIKADSTKDKEFMGVVSKIAPTAIKDANGNTASSSNVQFDTEVTLKDKDPNIKIGMNVRLTIKLNEKKGVYSVPYDAIVKDADGSQYINVIDSSKQSSKAKNAATKIKVEKGMETDMYVEVSSPDLKDGMNVEINSTSSAK